MRKFFISASALALLATASYSEQNTEPATKHQMRAYLMMNIKMLDKQIEMSEMQQAAFSSYQLSLKKMLDDDLGGANRK